MPMVMQNDDDGRRRGGDITVVKTFNMWVMRDRFALKYSCCTRLSLALSGLPVHVQVG